MKSILFLGGGELGIPALKWAKEIGFKVIVNDRNANAPGIKLADISLNFDSEDIRGLVTWSLNNSKKYNIRYCYCNNDFGLLAAANINQVLGAKHSSIKSVINSLDKNLMKKCWQRAKGVNYPKSSIIKSENEAIKVAAHLGWPIIIKPTSSSGSQGVGFAVNISEVKKVYREAKQYAARGEVIAEQFLKGSHHDVNGIFWDGKFFPAGIADRFFSPPPYFVPYYGYFPSSIPKEKQVCLYKQLEIGARALGINWGPVKADCVIVNGKCYVYEIANRFHGDILTARTMGFLGKKNPIYQYLNWIFNEEYDTFSSVDLNNRVGGWRTIFFNINNFNKNKIEGIFVKNIVKHDNKLIKNNGEIVGIAWAWKKNRQEINKYLEQIESHD